MIVNDYPLVLSPYRCVDLAVDRLNMVELVRQIPITFRFAYSAPTQCFTGDQDHP